MSRRAAASAAAMTTAFLALASCASGGDAASEGPSASSSPSTTVSIPAGASLTKQGSGLSFGDTATVAFEPDQTKGTVLELTVKRAIQGSTKDFSGFILDDYTKAATPYYVDVAVKNLGQGDVGGVPVPLWGVDAKNTLLPAARFTTSFRKCPSKQLPSTFGKGDTFDTCLVFLAPDHGTMRSVSYRPDQSFNPIQWTGNIATPQPDQKQ